MSCSPDNAPHREPGSPGIFETIALGSGYRKENQLGLAIVREKPHLLNPKYPDSHTIQSFFETPLPPILDWEITEECQLKCPICYSRGVLKHEGIREFGTEELNFEQRMQVVDKVVRAEVKTVCITGGDPLSTPGFLEILKDFKQQGVSVILNSNGMPITEEKGEYKVKFFDQKNEAFSVPLATLLENIDQISFSFDLTDPNGFRGSFPDYLADVVREIKDYSRKTKRDIQVQLTTTLSKITSSLIESDVLPQVLDLTVGVIEDNLQTGQAVSPPVWKIGMFQPQMSFDMDHNLMHSLSYKAYCEVFDSVQETFSTKYRERLAELSDDVEALLSDYPARVNKHYNETSFRCMIIMPNGVIMTNQHRQEEEFKCDGMGCAEYLPLGHLNTETPWLYAEAAKRVADTVTNRIKQLKGDVFERVSR